MVAAAEQVARATRGVLRFILVAANLAFLSLFGIYANLWTYQIDWVVITPLLYCLGAVAEGVPIIPTRTSARVRGHSNSPSPSEP